MSATQSGCWHCGEALRTAENPQAVVAGRPRAVCCIGCRAAAEWIDGLGLADYYRLRSEPATRPVDTEADRRDTAVWMRPEMARHVVRDLDNGRHEAMMLVDGVRCTACVWLIERALGTLPGIESVQVNASAQRARVVWDSATCTIAHIVETLSRAGYHTLPLDARALDDTRRTEIRSALKRLIVAGLGAMQAMMYASALYLGAFGGAFETMDASTRDLMRWFGLLVATPVVFYSARPFFAGALRCLRGRTLGMDVPVALAIALIYAASLFQAIVGGGDVYFDSVNMFVFLLLIGRYFEMRARHRAGDLSDALTRLAPVSADRRTADESLERVAAIELLPGDRVRVADGASVPADGVLLSGQCRVDEALLSGESTPLLKRAGDTLIAGSVVIDAPADMRVERVGPDTALAGIIALVTRAQTERPRLGRAGERAASGFVARVLILATLTAIGWAVFDPSRAFTAMLAVLVVSCPCAFAIAVPASLTRALALLARRGVLVVRPDAIENLATATHVVFDKTGTLTDPKLTLTRIQTLRESEPGNALSLAAALSQGSRHPVGAWVAQACATANPAPIEALRSYAGDGLEGVVAGQRVRLGQADFALRDQPVPPGLRDSVVLADDAGAIAAFHITERLRPCARTLVDACVADGLTVEILSGDDAGKVAAIAAQLGIARWRARQRPADKLARLAQLRAEGARVVAIGDGINDSPVLAGADVAIALADGNQLAQAVSDIVLRGQHLDRLTQARRVARETLAVLRQNQRWAFGYNLVAVPFAALGYVPPWLAALGMSVSSLVVVLNALRIGRHRDRAESPRSPAPQATPQASPT